jgi:hypothetical protein
MVGAAFTAPAISASESALGSHPCGALSSAQLNFLIDTSGKCLTPQHTLLPITSVTSVTNHPDGSSAAAQLFLRLSRRKYCGVTSPAIPRRAVGLVSANAISCPELCFRLSRAVSTQRHAGISVDEPGASADSMTS